MSSIRFPRIYVEMDLSTQDTLDLQSAKAKLENHSLATRIATKAGMPIEVLVRKLPERFQTSLNTTVNKALEQCLHIALSVSGDSPMFSGKSLHTSATALSGAVGGFFGLPGLLLELPVTTTIMLHSIAEIARVQGEVLTTPESTLACLQVFALGTEGKKEEGVDSAYYATRAALAQATRDAATHLAQNGMTKEGAPALLSFLGKVGARFGVEISEKAAAQLVPIVGAVGGGALNVLFMHHFQQLAEGHFAVRRLERKYGATLIHQEYQRLAARANTA